MWPVVAALHDAGHTALAPTLPGHGTRPEDLLDVGWSDWLEAAADWPTTW
jgi:carboxylesterase